MSVLHHPAAQRLVAEARLTPALVRGLGRRLRSFLDRYQPLFPRAEQRDNAALILEGKLSALSRKTCEPIAHALGVRREVLQDFIGASPWADATLLTELRTHVREAWGDPNGVLIVDGSSFPKRGEHSCGVQRQYCGRLGKIENCQLGLFLGYACRHGQTLVAHRLFVPPDWLQDPPRRAATGVPAAVVYRETWELALEQLDTCGDLPHAWVTADAEFGRVNDFRAGLRARGERFVVAVRSDLRLRDLRAAPPPRRGRTGRRPSVPPETSAEAWAAAQPATAWRRFEIRGGELGPLRVEAVETWVETFEASRVGPVERLTVIRTVAADEPKTWYTLSNADATIPLRQVVWAHGQRHWIEASFQAGKSEVGLGDYEVRSWRGWHHHMTMSLLALWFLGWERSRLKKKRPR
jgi:SRSO17 transposase